MKPQILLVDDDSNHNTYVVKLLEEAYRVFVAENGKSALEFLHKSIPNLILLDWNMPIMDGLTTLKSIKNDLFLKNIPVIMITGFMTDNDNLLLAYNEGVIDFIRKPFDEMELLARIQSIIQLNVLYKESLLAKEQQVFNSAIHLMAQQEFISSILTKINNVIQNDSNLEELKQLRFDLQSKIVQNAWEQVENSFNKINPDFYKNLLQKHADLTPAELKLAALLRLNLSSKDIANITNLSVEGIRVSRSRLKKKLLLRENDNLTSYLHFF